MASIITEPLTEFFGQYRRRQGKGEGNGIGCGVVRCGGVGCGSVGCGSVVFLGVVFLGVVFLGVVSLDVVLLDVLFLAYPTLAPVKGAKNCRGAASEAVAATMTEYFMASFSSRVLTSWATVDRF